MNKDNYHSVVIGAGPAGYSAALRLASAGKKVCLIEKSREDLGGTCLNSGCIPVKSFLESINLYQKINSAFDFGIEARASYPDLKKIQENADNHIASLRKGIIFLLKSKGVNLRFGVASFLSGDKIQLKEKNVSSQIDSKNFILATGSKPKTLSVFKVDDKKVFDSRSLCTKLPDAKNVLIVGGGYIGCEFAHFYSSLGSEVTIVDSAPFLLPGLDPEAVKVLEKEFLRRGMKLFTSYRVTKSDLSGLKVKVEIENFTSQDRKEYEFDTVIVSVGRSPDTSELNLEAAGVEKEGEYIKVNESFQTTASNIYAVGDLLNTPMLAHVAFKEAEKAAAAILKKEEACFDYRLVPQVVFTEPQISSFGLTESEAKIKNIEVGIRRVFFQSNPKARILGQASGFAKLIFDKENMRLLGASIVGPQATELIHILITFAKFNSSVEVLEKIIYAHPTLSELFGSI